jgi:hypothetical protein
MNHSQNQDAQRKSHRYGPQAVVVLDVLLSIASRAVSTFE